MSPSRLSNYLSGSRKPDIDVLSKIADYFAVSLDYFSTLNNSFIEDDTASLLNYVSYLASIDKTVSVEISTELGTRKFDITAQQVSVFLNSCKSAMQA